MLLNGGVPRGQALSHGRVGTHDVSCPDWRSEVTGFTPGNGWGLGVCIVRHPQGVTGMLSPGTFGHGGVYGTQVWIDMKRGVA